MLRAVLVLVLTALTASTAWAVPVGLDDSKMARPQAGM